MTKLARFGSAGHVATATTKRGAGVKQVLFWLLLQIPNSWFIGLSSFTSIYFYYTLTKSVEASFYLIKNLSKTRPARKGQCLTYRLFGSILTMAL